MTTKLFIILSSIRILFRQLYLSITSVDFYYDVFMYYKGYGIRYLFIISFISSLIYSVFLLNNIVILRDYFSTNKTSNYSRDIEVILKQLPIIHYDGNNISINEETPLYLYNSSNNKVAVIDTKNQLPMSERLKIPIIFTNNKINISLTDANYSKNTKHSHRIIDYSTILGLEAKTFTPELIKKQFVIILDTAKIIAIYIITPILVVVIFIFRLLENSLLITSTYLLTYLLGPRASLQTCIRLIIFSSGVRSLLHIISMVLFPQFVEFIWYIQIWCCFLLFKGMVKVRENLSC